MASAPPRTSILLVDDLPANLLSLEALLEPLGQELIKAHSGEQALKAVLTTDFACVLLDVHMPGMSGFDTARLIRARERSRELPILFVTATAAHLADPLSGYLEGAVDYLIKPLDPVVVRAKVKAFVELKQRDSRMRRQEADLRARQLEVARQEGLAAARTEERAHLRRLFDQLPAALGMLRAADRRYLLANPALRRLAGGRDLIGQTAEQAHPELLGQEFFEHVDQALATKQTVVARRIRLRFDLEGTGRPTEGFFDLTLVPMATVDDIEVLLFAVERTEEVLARRQLEASEERLRLATEASGVGVWEFDLAGGRSWRNEQFDRVLGYASPLPVWSIPLFLEHVAPVDRARVEGTIAATIGRRGSFSDEFRVHGPDAAERWVAVRGRVQRFSTGGEESGGEERLVGTSVDITLRKHNQEELERAVHLRDEFLSVAAHELRTPLTALTLKIQGLHERLPHTAPEDLVRRLPKDLALLRRQARRLTFLVDQLLDVSRIGAGSIELHPSRVDLAAVVSETSAGMDAEAARAGSSLERDLEPGVVGEWDEQRLEQVVANLLSNAIRYGAGRPIHIDVRRQGPTARLSIRDEGIGIEPKLLHHIFDKFERGESSRHYGGLGLGLYVSRQLVEAMGGTLRAESIRGQGATFTAELPACPEHDEASEPLH